MYGLHSYTYTYTYTLIFMSLSKTAFITGITGQDGSYLTEFLLEKGYDVHGLVRWDCVDTGGRIDAFKDRITLHYGDMNDANNLTRLIKEIAPDEVYNLAALSHVQVSFETPSSAFQTNAQGTLNLLGAVRVLDMQNNVRMYQASSSEMFGSCEAPQNEDLAFHPCSPYGVSKLAAYWLARNYRDAYGFHISNGILFNHESPVRGEDFVTRKITRAVAAIEAGVQDVLILGNLDSVRDWGHARDYVEGMWMMVQADHADDYVLATGNAHTVREFTTAAFAEVGVSIVWRGEATNEHGIDGKTGRILIKVDPALFRPKDVNYLLGDPRKAFKALGWAPRIGFNALVKDMVEADRSQYKESGQVWIKPTRILQKIG